MANFIIGDIHGCYNELLKLLDVIKLSDADTLWLTGDVVAKGPDSIKVLRFIEENQKQIKLVLGNHDLHLINLYQDYVYHNIKPKKMSDVINASDSEELIFWLKSQPFIQIDNDLKLIMSHAGISPEWNLQNAIDCDLELCTCLLDSFDSINLNDLYGDHPNKWHNQFDYMDRLRYSVNAFTRMRYCFDDKSLDFDCKLPPNQAGKALKPWYEFASKIDEDYHIAFGHWSALSDTKINKTNIHALDTGCCWGGALTAMRFEDKKRFQVKSLTNI